MKNERYRKIAIVLGERYDLTDFFSKKCFAFRILTGFRFLRDFTLHKNSFLLSYFDGFLFNFITEKVREIF